MRRTPNPAITARMYRHFAVVTVLVTVTVAVFANGEKHQALAAETSTDRVEPVVKADKPTSVRSQSPADGDSGTWGSDDGDFGRPTTFSGWADAAFGDNSNLAHPFEGSDADSASDADDGDSVRSAFGGGDSAPPTAAQIAAVTAASRMRSGSADSD